MKRKLKYLITFTLINVPYLNKNDEHLYQLWTHFIDAGIENEEKNELAEMIMKTAINFVLETSKITVKEENIKFTGVYLLDTVILPS